MFLLQDGFTPIDVAVQQGHEKVVAALLHHDSRVRMFNLLNNFYRSDSKCVNFVSLSIKLQHLFLQQFITFKF